MAKKLKIAFLSLSFGAVERGAETFVREVSERLRAFGHEVDIIAAGKAHARRWPILWRTFIDPQGIQVCLFTLKNLPEIWREKYDVVVPIDGGWQPAWVRLITWLYGGKMIISGQSGKGWDDRNNLWSFPNAFVAISSRLKSWAKKFNPFVRVEYIPNGVDINKFKKGGGKYKTKLRKPIVLCVAALEKDKRIDSLIQATAKLKKASLLVVGDGLEKSNLIDLATKLIKGRFEFTKLPFEKMPLVYRAADVFSYPTVWWESFGIVMVEAMASGLPIVVTNDPIRAEIIGKAGILVDPIDTDAYAKALQEALETNWGDKPRLQAEKFSWDKIANKYEELFLELVK